MYQPVLVIFIHCFLGGIINISYEAMIPLYRKKRRFPPKQSKDSNCKQNNPKAKKMKRVKRKRKRRERRKFGN